MEGPSLIQDIIQHVFGPELGYIDYEWLTMQNLEDGTLVPIEDVPESGVIVVKEWSNNRWNIVEK
jgi:hypothetical protein